MCKFVYFACSSYFGCNATLVAVVFSCHVGLSPHLHKNQDYFMDLWKKRPCRPISDKMLFGLNQIYPDIMYGVARENNAVDLIPHQKQGKTIPVIASTLPKCMAMFLWTSLPSFSKSTQREQSIITVEKGISVDQPKTLLPLNHCFSQTSELDKRRCILSEVVPESAFKYYCDLFNRRSYQDSVHVFDVFVLDIPIFSSNGDRSQISQMKMTDG